MPDCSKKTSRPSGVNRNSRSASRPCVQTGARCTDRQKFCCLSSAEIEGRITRLQEKMRQYNRELRERVDEITREPRDGPMNAVLATVVEMTTQYERPIRMAHLNGMRNGVVNGALNGMGGGLGHPVGNGIGNGVLNGMEDEMPFGIGGGGHHRHGIRMLNAMGNGIQNGMGNGNHHGMGNGNHHGMGNGNHHGMGNGVHHGMGNGVHHGMGNGVHHGMGNGINHGMGNGVRHGMGNGIHHGMGNGIPHGMGNGIPNGVGLGHGPRNGMVNGNHSPVRVEEDLAALIASALNRFRDEVIPDEERPRY